MKLTDLELCKKIAEIEGVPIDCIDCIDGEWLGIHGKYDIEEYNPFDWSWLGPMMIKYEVSVNFQRMTIENEVHRFDFCDNNELPRAILEFIVVANS